jgi:SEL1 protein
LSIHARADTSPGRRCLVVQADEAQAVLHYYYAAAAGDPVARMALGHRHQHGLGVPKSCWTAVSYYQPVAEQVADAAAAGGALPSVERIRLHVAASKVRRRSAALRACAAAAAACAPALPPLQASAAARCPLPAAQATPPAAL